MSRFRSTPPDLPSPVNHVFVDCENVHHVDTEVIGQKAVNFMFLYGPKKAKFDVAVVQKLIEHAASVQLVRLTSSGRSALDLTLAYYLGRCVLADPTACFHIVSKDEGFDPLIEHLRSQHINARRHDDFTTLTFSGARA
jgi:PIN domain